MKLVGGMQAEGTQTFVADGTGSEIATLCDVQTLRFPPYRCWFCLQCKKICARLLCRQCDTAFTSVNIDLKSAAWFKLDFHNHESLCLVRQARTPGKLTQPHPTRMTQPHPSNITQPHPSA